MSLMWRVLDGAALLARVAVAAYRRNLAGNDGTRYRKRGESIMIEELQDVPAGVAGIRISGRVTAEDFQQFKPTLDRMLDSEEIRFVEVIGPDYEGFGPGGLLADIKQGFNTLTHIRAFKRTAVVTDKEWVAHALHATAWMIPGEVALFGLDELEAAKQWAAG